MTQLRTGLLALLMAAVSCASSQTSNRGEFADQPNGLMYADSNMRMLGHMVDSLNIRFRHCDLAHTYYSNPQGRFWHLEFASTTDNLARLRGDLARNKSLDYLLSTYKDVLKKMDTTGFIVEAHFNGDEREYVYLTGEPENGYESNYSLNRGKERLPSREWVQRFDPKDKYTKENSVDAWYLPQPLARQRIPDEYARYLQYADCMIDTNTTIFLTQKRNRPRQESDDAAYKALVAYLNQKTNARKKGKDDWEYNYLSERKIEFAETHLRNDERFMQLLEDAVESCIEYDDSRGDLEALTAAVLSKAKALELKRHRIVAGMCSQDQSPRLHARNIAILAAETNSWDIFLRAHLDIMNDRFERRSDGSYAYGGRKTYLKELEVLDIDVIDLMFGLTLRAADLPEHHYYGTVWRLGWAMSESKDKGLFEDKILHMLKDRRLDEFNRGLLFILYHSYLNHLDDKAMVAERIRVLQQAADEFPGSIKAALLAMK